MGCSSNQSGPKPFQKTPDRISFQHHGGFEGIGAAGRIRVRNNWSALVRRRISLFTRHYYCLRTPRVCAMVLANNSKEKSRWRVSLSFAALLLAGSAGARFEREERIRVPVKSSNEVNARARYACCAGAD